MSSRALRKIESDADPKIGRLLQDLVTANEAGQLRCLVAIAFDREGVRTAILGGMDQDRILGAIERLKWALLQEDESETADPPSRLN